MQMHVQKYAESQDAAAEHTATIIDFPQNRVTREPSADVPRHTRAADQFVKIPNAYLQRLANRGKATASAVQLVAWIEYRRKTCPNFVPTLAEASKKPQQGGLGMHKKAFDAAMRIRVDAGLVERWQTAPFAAAEEKPTARKGKGFVQLDPALILTGPAKLVAFVAMVLLNPSAVHPRRVAAGFLDIRDDEAVTALVKQALAGAHLAGGKVGGKWVVGRPDKVAKPVKNDAPQPPEKGTTYKEKVQSFSNSAPEPSAAAAVLEKDWGATQILAPPRDF